MQKAFGTGAATNSIIDLKYTNCMLVIGANPTAAHPVTGARIKQDVGVDTNPIEFWQPEPAGLIYINYVTQEEADRIIAEGKREEAKDGSLDGLNVGN